MLCATPLSLVLSFGSECCNAKSNIPHQNWLNVLDVTHEHSKKDFVTLKESHVVEIVLTAAARVKHSVRAPISICLILLLLSFKNDLHRESFPTRWLWQSTTFWSGREVWTMIWIMMNQPALSVVVCTCYLCFPVSYAVVLSIGHLDVLHRRI